MADLTPDDFPSFFRAVYGYAPFVWQADLARRISSGGGWPEGIDVPTGLGKTAVLDMAVFSLAAQAHLSSVDRTAPTRTFVVVDRRLIVDQTFERARFLQERLGRPSEEIVERVARALRSLSGGGPALEVVRMRGGVTWESQWLDTPDQPAIVVGTVDQYGSRVLFRGYGVGSRRRPIDAALTGADALLVLDEAHLSQPLVKTMRSVHRYERASELPILRLRRPRPALLSATLGPDLLDVFRPDLAAESSPVARARIDASKRVVLVDLKSKGKDPTPDLASCLVQIALDRANDDDIDRVAIVCNTVAAARMAFGQLKSERDRLGIEFDCVLLIGRCRQYERDRVANAWVPELEATSERLPRSRPLIAVATQTVEVGADFDFDALVSEVAPIDAILQRVGRLNRFGLRPSADAVIVRVAARHDDDPVYGSASSRTWGWLGGHAGHPVPTPVKDVVGAARSGPSIDLGLSAARGLLTPDEKSLLAAEPTPAAEVIGPTLAAWARTQPAPEPDQPVAPFLHGLGRVAPEVLVAWRAALPSSLAVATAREEWEVELRSTPPSPAECVSVPIWEARRFLQRRPIGSLADIEGIEDDEEDLDPFEERQPAAAFIVDPDGTPRAAGPDQLRPGDTLVVRAEEGGHDEWGWTGQANGAQPVLDIADLSRMPMRPRLRLRPELLAVLVGGDDQTWRKRLDEASSADDDERSPADVVERLLEYVRDAQEDPVGLLAPELGKVASSLLAGPYRPSRVSEKRPWYVAEARKSARLPMGTGDDGEVQSSAGSRKIGLEQHLNDVAERAAEYANRMGLPPELVRAVELAGRTHDLGKADARFQSMLHGGDRLRSEAWPKLLAKSGMDPADRALARRAREASGWPAGMRHEAISTVALAAVADADPALVNDVDLDLVLHLVATHHGNGRPLLPAVLDESPVDVRAHVPGHGVAVEVRSGATIDWSAPARFERLGARYGWWGLALLESVVRLADIACSKEYEKDLAS